MPFLHNIRLLEIPPQLQDAFPFSIPAIRDGLDLELTGNVSFLVGENGSGKSTILEAIASHCGFHPGGGNRHHQYRHVANESELDRFLQLSWRPKRITEGFFLRAESFFNFANYIDEQARESPRWLNNYGGKPLHQQSHGESFLALFSNLFESGIYLLDEPEAALSPQRQLTFLRIIHQLDISGRAQFIIATHSPMLLTYPGATIFALDEAGVQETTYRETEHFKLMKRFLDSPEAYYRFLFQEEE